MTRAAQRRSTRLPIRDNEDQLGRLVLPLTPANPNAENDVSNPPRIAPRHLFDLSVGSDNLFHATRTKVKVRFSVLNLDNKDVLYNLLSTFSGTHFVTPRAYTFTAGIAF